MLSPLGACAALSVFAIGVPANAVPLMVTTAFGMPTSPGSKIPLRFVSIQT